MTSDEAIHQAEQILGYRFKDIELLESALKHASYTDSRLESNERMEFFGDAVLGFVVCEALYERYPEYLEGELTKIKSAVVSRKTCAEIAQKCGLETCLLLGKGIEDRGDLPSSLLAAVYEAVIAAIYLDGGLVPAREFIMKDMADCIDRAAKSQTQQNYKSHLQQYAQKQLGASPVYELLDEKGPDHNKCFEVCVWVGGKRSAGAWGSSKKEAEQKAALAALLELGVLRKDCD